MCPTDGGSKLNEAPETEKDEQDWETDVEGDDDDGADEEEADS